MTNTSHLLSNLTINVDVTVEFLYLLIRVLLVFCIMKCLWFDYSIQNFKNRVQRRRVNPFHSVSSVVVVSIKTDELTWNMKIRSWLSEKKPNNWNQMHDQIKGKIAIEDRFQSFSVLSEVFSPWIDSLTFREIYLFVAFSWHWNISKCHYSSILLSVHNNYR